MHGFLRSKTRERLLPYRKYKFPPPQNKIPLRNSNNGQRRSLEPPALTRLDCDGFTELFLPRGGTNKEGCVGLLHQLVNHVLSREGGKVTTASPNYLMHSPSDYHMATSNSDLQICMPVLSSQGCYSTSVPWVYVLVVFVVFHSNFKSHY